MQMFFAKIMHQLNLKAQCDSMGVGLFACPQFIFLIMGVVIAVSISSAYILVQKFAEPEIAAMIILMLSAFLIIIAFAIVKAFEKVVEARKNEIDEAHKLIELKDQFVLVAAHELRIPASAIKWVLDELELSSKKFSKDDLEHFKMIKKSNERLLGLVSDMLEASKTEGKRINIELSDVSLYDAVEDSIVEAQKNALDQKITIVNDIENAMPKAFADPTRVREILVNLLTNAIKYSSEGGEVRVSGEIVDGKCIVHVEDNGRGIKPEDFDKVFTKFWRATEVQNIDGTGLGLFIVRQLLKMMEGEIWFKSKYKEGSTFSFSLKAAQK